MTLKRLRAALPLVIMVAVGVGYTLNYGTGSLSSLGWRDVSLICPLGALGAMLAAKTVIPRAVFSLLFAVVFILLFGRAFCSWICPVPVVSQLRNAFRSKESLQKEAAETVHTAPTERAPRLDSRHLVLLGALLSATVFGFPVFCLVCPVGLTFATIFAVITLFGEGVLNWSVIVMPAILLVEVVFFKHWCSTFCPLSALLSLVAKGNRTFRPTIDKTRCMEASADTACGACARSCHQGIDLRHPEVGASRSECTRCRSCVETCPMHAISMPLLARPAKAVEADDAAILDEE